MRKNQERIQEEGFRAPRLPEMMLLTRYSFMLLLICAVHGGVIPSAPPSFSPQPSETESPGNPFELASLNRFGDAGNPDSEFPSISGDGQTVAFLSRASDLVQPDQLANSPDIFVYDRQTVSVEAITLSQPSFTPWLSKDGQVVVFYSTHEFVSGVDVFVHYRGNQSIQPVILPGPAFTPSINANGRYVSTEGNSQIYLSDLWTGSSAIVSKNSNGVNGNGISTHSSMSDDGKVIVFRSESSNLVENDTNSVADIFVHHVTNMTTFRVSVSSEGNETSSASSFPAISGNGRYVLFASEATDLDPACTSGVSHVYVHDIVLSSTTCITVNSTGYEGDGNSNMGRSNGISFDGRYVCFASNARNLASWRPDDGQQVHVLDRHTNVTTLVSITLDGEESNSGSFDCSINSTGQYVAFTSRSTNLHSRAVNGKKQVYVRKLW